MLTVPKVMLPAKNATLERKHVKVLALILAISNPSALLFFVEATQKILCVLLSCLVLSTTLACA